MSKKIYIVDLESLENRYTIGWKTHIPNILREKGHEVVVIEGAEDIPLSTTPGAFLNFGGTSVYKSTQIEKISRLFCAGEIKAGDHFLFTDAWNPGIINLKYMSELLGVKVIIHALWHSGAYDPWDFLGRIIGNDPWVRLTEKSFFEAVDHNYFATDFHIDMFRKNLLDVSSDQREYLISTGKIVRTGWPMEYMEKTLHPYKNIPKENIVLFPHRIAPEKQVEMFRDLAQYVTEAQFVVAQDTPLTKNQYHILLAKSKIVFSSSLQETLGISIGCEGPLLNAIPMSPNRLSYSEVFDGASDLFLYPQEWTSSWGNYLYYRPELISRIKHYLAEYESYIPLMDNYLVKNYSKYFHADELYRRFQ